MLQKLNNPLYEGKFSNLLSIDEKLPYLKLVMGTGECSQSR
jgi:hypothetical protein